MTMNKSPLNTSNSALERMLRDESRRVRAQVHIDVADRVAGQLPPVDRTVQRGGGSRMVFVIALIVLGATVVGVTMYDGNRPASEQVVTPITERILPERRFTQEDVAIHMTSWTQPLETEARAIVADLSDSVDAVRSRLPVPARLKKPDQEGPPSN